jgi:putative hydrolase of the HAD superfamily
VFFDAGGTLFRPYPSVGHVYSRLAKKHGCAVAPAWIEARFHAVWKRHSGLSHLKTKNETTERLWWERLVREAFGARFPRQDFPAYFHELYDLFARPETWRLFPDALPTLKTLKRRGLRLGVVSNWDSRLFALCDSLGVSREVEFVLASAVVGAAKPEKKIFELALRRAAVKPAEALHVGDTYRDDYWGARQAGLAAAFLCRKGPGPKDVFCVESLTELKDWVLSEGTKKAPARPAAGA